MFTVTFNPQTPEQLQVVAVAMASYLSLTAVEVETVVETAEAPKAKRARKPEPEAPVVVEPQPFSESVVTLVEIRAKLADLSQKGHGDAVRELLAKFGVKKLTDVLVEDFASLLAEAEAI